MTQPRWREWPPDIQSVLFLTVPVIPEWSFCFPTATTRFIWSVRTRRGTARYQLNSDLWPTGFPSALGVRDSLPVNKSAVIRGYKTGAVSFGLENAPGTYYQRLQINPNGTVVYYYLPEGATTLKTATLVHLEDLLWLCWRQQNSDLDSTRNFFVFKTASQKNITAGETGFWHEKIKIPSGYKVLYVSATYNNADSCMLTSYDATITCIGNTSDIEPWFGFYATRTGTGTFTAYAVCVKI